MLQSFDVFSSLSPLLGRSHWYIAVICFPWLEEAVYEECPHQNSLSHRPQHSLLEPESENTRAGSVFLKDEEETGGNRSLFSKGAQSRRKLCQAISSFNSVLILEGGKLCGK